MASFKTVLKKRRKKGEARFRSEYVRALIGERHKPKKLGLPRTVFSAFSLILGGGLCYIALHYIPAYLSVHKLLALSTPTEAAAINLKSKNSAFGILTPYVDSLRMRRTYLRSGQAIRAQYVIPEGAELELTIRYCKPDFVREIFDCEVIGEKTETIRSGTVGTQKFMFQNTGFYTFHNKITMADNEGEYRVIWSRS